MSLLKIIVSTTDHLKPVLLKVFPHELLRRMKGRVIRQSHKKLLDVAVEPFDRTRFADGINLIGNIKADTGLGQSCRLVAAELEYSRMPYSVYQYDQLGIMSSTDMQFAGKISSDLPFNINLIHINPHELGLAFQQLGQKVWDGHYNIGFWLWELEEFPEEKPVLLKVFPHELLRRMKGRVIRQSHKKLLDVVLEPFDRTRFIDGINLIGNIKADTGLGQSCRLVAAELEYSRMPYSVYQYDQLGIMSSTDMQFAGKISSDLPFNINLIHINPHELGLAFQQLGQKVWDGHYNIGFWLWELEEFPEEWIPCFHCLDEIWTPSEFISRAVRKKTKLPVKTVPYHVETRLDQVYERSEFGLPEDMYLFLMMYDRTSMTERKNPEAVIQAYKKAFTREDKAGLVIKINNCTDEEINALKKELEDYPHVYFISQVMDRSHVNSLIRCVDAVVSLHRAEGFGLVLAEAMMLGTPTIATNWSSNTEFMTRDTSLSGSLSAGRTEK